MMSCAPTSFEVTLISCRKTWINHLPGFVKQSRSVHPECSGFLKQNSPLCFLLKGTLLTNFIFALSNPSVPQI